MVINFRAALIILGLFAGVASARQVGQISPPLAIIRVNVIDPIAAAVATNMMVLIRNGRIVSVGTGAAPRGAEIVDGSNRFLIAGLWDMHVHLSYARASALSVFVANGVTGIRDIGSDLGEIDRWRRSTRTRSSGR
jgi:predicted amidohydrolase